MSTSAIDKKKNKLNSLVTDPNTAYEFLSNTLSQLIKISLVVVIGSLMLYSARASQSNLFPKCIEKIPYTDEAIQIYEWAEGKNTTDALNHQIQENCYSIENDVSKNDPIKRVKLEPLLARGSGDGDDTNDEKLPPHTLVPINIMNVKDEETNETTDYFSYIRFDTKENLGLIKKSNLFLYEKFFKGYGDDKPGFFTFIKESFQSNIAFAIGLISQFYQLLNTNCSESVIVFVGPLILPFVILLITIITFLYGVYKSFIGISKIFDWTAGAMKGLSWWFTWILYLVCMMIFLGILFLGGFFFLPFITLAIVIMCFIYSLRIKSQLVHIKEGVWCEENFSVFTLIGRIFKYKLHIIMLILSVLLIDSSGKYYGTNAQVITAVVCILMYFFSSPIYMPFKPSKEDIDKIPQNILSELISKKVETRIFRGDIKTALDPDPFNCLEKNKKTENASIDNDNDNASTPILTPASTPILSSSALPIGLASTSTAKPVVSTPSATPLSSPSVTPLAISLSKK